MKPGMILSGIAALAIAAATAAAQTGGSTQLRPFQPARPVQTTPLHQPSNLELMASVNQLSEQVEQLSGRVQQLTDRLTALNNHVASMSGSIGQLAHDEHAHYVTVGNTARATCGLLYLHHWVTNSPGHPYQSSLYCDGSTTENGIYMHVE